MLTKEWHKEGPRLSPFVSGCVYTAYAYFVTTLIPKSRDEKYNADRNSSFPNNWHNSTAGKVGLVFFGIAFVAATLVQLEATFTRRFPAMTCSSCELHTVCLACILQAVVVMYSAYKCFVPCWTHKSRIVCICDTAASRCSSSLLMLCWRGHLAGLQQGICGFCNGRENADREQIAGLDRSFHVTLRNNMPAWFRWVVLVSGHLGHLARGAVFMFVAVLFFRTVGGEVAEGRTTVGDALEQLRGHPAGETVLFLMGTSSGFALRFLCFFLRNSTPPPNM